MVTMSPGSTSSCGLRFLLKNPQCTVSALAGRWCCRALVLGRAMASPPVFTPPVKRLARKARRSRAMSSANCRWCVSKAGQVGSSPLHMALSSQSALGQKIDLDHGTARQAGDADAGSSRPAIGREVAGIDLVHARVVGLEVGEARPGEHHALEAQLEPCHNDLDILPHPHRLALDVGL